jgi:hypothetical protein
MSQENAETIRCMYERWAPGRRSSSLRTSARSDPGRSGAISAQAEDLVALEGRLGIPVYWAGEPGEETVELTRTADDRVYVRYLDQGVEPGDPDPSFLTVGTYPLDGAFKLIEKAARRDGAVVEDGPEGSLVVTNEDSLTSVYVGFPGEESGRGLRSRSGSGAGPHHFWADRVRWLSSGRGTPNRGGAMDFVERISAARDAATVKRAYRSRHVGRAGRVR